MLFFTRPILMFCGVAIALGIGADALFMALTILSGGGGLLLRPGRWVMLFGALWLIAFAIGLLVVKEVGVFPFR
jgi:hypothetical protein